MTFDNAFRDFFNLEDENPRKRTNNLPASLFTPPQPYVRPQIDQNERQALQEPYGPPEGWDYRTAETGWQGEALPSGATSWDAYGRPYFGEGLSGWWKKTVSNFTRPVEDLPTWEEFQAENDIDVEELKNAWQIWTPEGRAQAGKWFESVGFLLDKSQNIAKTDEEGKETDDPTALSKVSRGIGAGVDAVLGALNLSAIAVKRSVGSLALGLEASAEGSALPDLPSFADRMDEGALQDGIQILSQMTVGPIWDAVRTVFAPTGRLDRFQEASQASRIAYTAFMDSAVQAEYIRRLQAGEDAGLLALELQNPIAEAFGEIVFDPLNFVGAFLTKGRKLGKLIDDARSLLILDETSDMGKVVKEIGELVANNADEAILGQKTQELIATRTAAVARVTENMGQVGRFSRGPFAYTPQAQRAIKADQYSSWLGRLMYAHQDSPDTALDVLEGLMRFVSKTDDEATAGLTLLRNYREGEALNLMLSDQAIETGLFLRNMLRNADGVVDPARLIDELSIIDDPAEIMALTGKKVGKALEGVFPTVGARIRNGDKTLTATQIAIHKWHTNAQKIVRPINTFFASIYMGLSPGYAARNHIQNNFHVLVDEGLGAYLSNRTVWTKANKTKNVTGWLGKMPQSVRGFTQAFGSRAKGSLGRFFQPVLKVSEDLEKSAALSVVNHTINKVMRNALDNGALAEDTLRAAGVNAEGVAIIKNLMFEHYGDVNKVAREFANIASDGTIELRKTLLWAAQDDLRQLDNAFAGRGDGVTRQLLEDLKNLPDDAVADDGVRLLEEIREEMQEAYTKASKEFPFGSADDIGSAQFPDSDDLTTLRDIGNNFADKDFANMVEAKIWVNNEAIRHYKESLDYITDNLIDRMLEGGVPLEKAQALRQLKSRALQIIDSQGSQAHGAQEALRKITREISDESIKTLSGRPTQATVDAFIAKYRQRFPDGVEAATGREVRDALWTNYFTEREDRWANFRDIVGKTVEDHFGSMDDATKKLLPNAENLITGDKIDIARESLTRAQEIQQRGAIVDEGLVLMNEGVELLDEAGEARKLLEGTDFERILPPLGDNKPSSFRAIAEGMESPRHLPNYNRLIDRLQEGLRTNWDTTEAVGKHDLSKWKTIARTRMDEARLVAEKVSEEARNYTLLDYRRKNNLDMALAYIYPFHFWYGRTYKNWMSRIIREPGWIAGYAKYKDALSKVHAGQPEWWKRNINTNELLGLDHENPIFFNLEATLNPLNGISGVDFEDPQRRVTWWSKFIDDLSRFGPTTWTPISLAAGLALHLRGESEAAQRFASRLLPQSRPIRSLTHLMGLEGPISGQSGIEIDPLTGLLHGGLDPYERRRVGRALGDLVVENPEAQAEILESARTQSGEWWNEAISRSFDSRAWGNISGFMAGVGFKGRSLNDMQIDQFYSDYFRTMEQRENFTNEEFRIKMNALEDKYPFMDALLLSRRGGYDRDIAYAYNVLGRIPPGRKSEVARMTGLPSELISKFYDTKGRIEDWSQSDRDRFMSAMVDIGAILDVPEATTRDEWDAASIAYSNMLNVAENIWGKDIQDRVDGYFALKDGSEEGRDAARIYLQTHPDVQQFLDWKSATVIQSPQLSPYYGGIEQIVQFWKGTMYDQAEQRFGASVFTIQDEYYDFKDAGDNRGARAFLNANPILRQYWDFKHEYEENVIFPNVLLMGVKFDEGIGPLLRDAEAQSLGQEQLQEGISQPQNNQIPLDVLIDGLGQDNFNIVVDSLLGGETLPDITQRKIREIALQLGVGEDMVMQMLSQAIFQQ